MARRKRSKPARFRGLGRKIAGDELCGPPRCRKVSREKAREEARCAVQGLMAAGLLRLFCEPPDAAGLAALAEGTVEKLSDLSSHVGPLAHRFAELLGAAREQTGWSVHNLFARLLVPALALMRAPKTRAFGVVTATMKLLWRTEDWPDPDGERSRDLHRFVLEHLFCGSDLLAGAWIVSHLGLDHYFAFDDLFTRLLENKQALRLYCGAAPLELQHRVVASLVNCASGVERKERREWLSIAADLIMRCNLDRTAFPEVARQKAINWMCYMVHKVPWHTAEDYARGDMELLALCIDQLASVGNLESATALYLRHTSGDLDAILRPATLESVRDACSGSCSAPPPDAFGPHETTALRLPLPEADIVWVDTAELATAAASVIAKSSMVGVDLEWSSFGDWLDPTLALLQLATPDQVFLVDLTAPHMDEAVDKLLLTMLGCEQPLVLCFSFENDVRELKRSRWATACARRRGLCDLQMLKSGQNGKSGGGANGHREGLSSLVKRTLGSPLCKAEQRSCWHRRPLREAQRHYAALDAFVLLQVGAALTSAPLGEPDLVASKLRAMVEADCAQPLSSS